MHTNMNPKDTILTTAPIAAPNNVALQPEFLRLPGAGQKCPLTGLRRSQIYNLINEGKIKSISLRKRGQQRGTRLIVADSLLSYLRGLAVEHESRQPIE